MSHLNPQITNELVIPQVESRFFLDHPDARFAIGVLAVGNSVIPGRENEYDAYFKLRRAVYLDQTGQLSLEDIAEDGTDRDQDDSRSIAFGVVENRGFDTRLVATARLIQKGLDSNNGSRPQPLPIEKEWPEIFSDTPAPSNAIEVSRLIVRHERAGIQAYTKQKLYTALLAYAIGNKLGPALAVVEDWFERDLNKLVPIARIGDPKYIEHYLDVNVPIEINMPKFAERIESEHPGSLISMLEKIGEVAYSGTIRQAAA